MVVSFFLCLLEICVVLAMVRNPRFGTTLYNLEEKVVNEAAQFYDEIMNSGSYEFRKEMMCAVFIDSTPQSLNILRRNIVASAGFCDWAVVVFDGNPDKVCADLTVVHCELFSLKNINTSIVSRQILNTSFIPKTILYEALVPYIQDYKRVWLMDQDISLMHLNIGKFLQIWDCSFVNQSAPLIVQPLIAESTQYYKYLHEESWTSLRAEGVVSSATGFVEQQVPAFDAIFLEWFIKGVISPMRDYALLYQSCWGNDITWCNAAKMYAERVLHWNDAAVVCGIIIGSGSVNHLNTRSILGHKHAPKSSYFTGDSLIEKYINVYPTWVHPENRFGKVDPLDKEYGIHHAKMRTVDVCPKWPDIEAGNVNQEVNALVEGRVHHTNDLKNIMQRKALLCVMFLSDEGPSVSNLYLNVMVTNDLCEWALVVYSGDPDNVCTHSWIKSRLALCKAFHQEKHYMNKIIPKSVLYGELLPLLSHYLQIVVFDEDISVKGVGITKFLKMWSCAFTSQQPPLIVQLLIHEKSTTKLAEKWARYRAEGVIASSTPYLEPQASAFDSRFLEWYIRRVIGRVMSSGFDLEADWGFERMLCSAAKAYSMHVLRWKREAVVCAILVGADPVRHIETRSMEARSNTNKTDLLRQALRSVQMYQKLFPTWKVVDPSYSVNASDSEDYVRSFGIRQACMMNITNLKINAVR